MGGEDRKLAGVSLRIRAPTDLLGLDSELPFKNAGKEKGGEHLFEASPKKLGLHRKWDNPNPFHTQTPAVPVFRTTPGKDLSGMSQSRLVTQAEPHSEVSCLQELNVSQTKDIPRSGATQASNFATLGMGQLGRWPNQGSSKSQSTANIAHALPGSFPRYPQSKPPLSF